jgi:hypothetical protein
MDLFDMWLEYNFGFGDEEWESTSTDKFLVLPPNMAYDFYTSATMPGKLPKEIDFLQTFLGKRINVTADLWAKLDMKL